MVHRVPHRYKAKMSQVKGALSPRSAVVRAEALAPVVTPFTPPLPRKQSSASTASSSSSSSSSSYASRAYERALDRARVEEEEEEAVRRRRAHAAP